MVHWFLSLTSNEMDELVDFQWPQLISDLFPNDRSTTQKLGPAHGGKVCFFFCRCNPENANQKVSQNHICVPDVLHLSKPS